MEIIDGRYLSAGEHNLYLKVTGLGLPVLVIEPAWGSLSAEWQLIQEELSKHMTVLSYDRAGYGESPASKSGRNSEQIADELNNLLRNSSLPGPFIFVGQAAGGFYVQHFAKMYPEQTGGLVLLDPIGERIGEIDELDVPVYQEKASTRTRLEGIRVFAEMEPEQFNGVIHSLVDNLYSFFPEELQLQLTEYLCDQTLYKTVVKEITALEDSIKLYKSLGAFPDVPVSVICRDSKLMMDLSKEIGIPEKEAEITEQIWLEQCESIAKQSQDGQFRVVEGGTQSMHLTHPGIVIEEVLKMAEKVREFMQLKNEGRIIDL